MDIYQKFALNRRSFIALSVGGVATALLPGVAAAQKRNLATDGLALEGYDPVAYFTQNAAVAGMKDLTAAHEGAVYRFSSEENRAAFVANPGKYLPLYGGFCAYAVSKGYTAAVDPQAFSIVDGKLYLNFSKRVRDIWSKDIPGNIKAADANWPTVSAN